MNWKIFNKNINEGKSDLDKGLQGTLLRMPCILLAKKQGKANVTISYRLKAYRYNI